MSDESPAASLPQFAAPHGQSPDDRPRHPPIGRFLIERELGRGTFGVVYLARDPDLGRLVALKVPLPRALDQAGPRERFLREAQATGTLEHPHIVPVYEHGTTDEALYVAAAFCEGPTLAQWLAQQTAPVPLTQAAAIVACLADAVHFGHQRGTLHGDLKPGNVQCLPRQTTPSSSADETADLPFAPRVTDFGLTRMIEARLAESGRSVIPGNAHYRSLEQAEGSDGQPGPASDIYSLGAILYELICGRPPIDSETFAAALDRLRDRRPVAPGALRPDVPRSLELICLKCLNKSPRDRYASANALSVDLRRFLRGEPVEARPLGLLPQVRWWFTRPGRVRDAGVCTIVLSAVLMAWIALAVILVTARLVPLTYAEGEIQWFYLDCSAMILGLHLPQVWLGRRMLRATGWALWLGLIVSIAQGGYVALVLFELLPPPFRGPYVDPVHRTNVFILLSMLFLIQAIVQTAGLAALSAARQRRRPDSPAALPG